jgi:hypothetical protein
LSKYFTLGSKNELPFMVNKEFKKASAWAIPWLLWSQKYFWGFIILDFFKEIFF